MKSWNLVPSLEGDAETARAIPSPAEVDVQALLAEEIVLLWHELVDSVEHRLAAEGVGFFVVANEARGGHGEGYDHKRMMCGGSTFLRR